MPKLPLSFLSTILILIFFLSGCGSVSIKSIPFDGLSPSLSQSKQTKMNQLWEDYLSTNQLHIFRKQVEQTETVCEDCYERWEMEGDYADLLANPRDSVSYYLNALYDITHPYPRLTLARIDENFTWLSAKQQYEL